MIFSQQLAAFAEATRNDVFDPSWEGGTWMVKSTETQESLADFEAASKGWIECSNAIRGEIAGLPYIAWERVQARKGDQRRALSVVDFGDRRIAIDEDLSQF
ncbi:hypothetical protein [Aquabacterium parvum]|uniref:hypothetical protein n=1 Tax=Aquabacterium parvum TaxID=70584 RepID=UPI00128FCA5F|nr:hypothetical protein [Aquabacterium parvum]MBU0916336.1 hypothetical protein [Gammaproteobacteria bacterium]